MAKPNGIKYIGYIIFIVLALLLTFFGIGPVVFADGSAGERAITFFIVLLCYIVLTFLFIRFNRWVNQKE